jgi:hypothetical protein
MIYVAPFDSCSGDRVVVFVIMASAEQISSDFPFGSDYVEAPGRAPRTGNKERIGRHSGRIGTSTDLECR